MTWLEDNVQGIANTVWIHIPGLSPEEVSVTAVIDGDGDAVFTFIPLDRPDGCHCRNSVIVADGTIIAKSKNVQLIAEHVIFMAGAQAHGFKMGMEHS